MCIITITKRYEKSNDEMIEGYKVFYKEEINSNKYQGLFYPIKFYREGIAYKSSAYPMIIYRPRFSYDSGFHMYLYKKDALSQMKVFVLNNYAICRVIMWNITTIGEDDKGPTVVAKNMIIMEELK